MDKCTLCWGQKMNVLSAAFANAIAENLTAAEIDFLSTFIQSVGENLATIAAADSLCQTDNNNEELPHVR